MIEQFFAQLAGYYRQENDLSNIVVALCNSSYDFRELFVRFFFPDIDDAQIDCIRREVPDNNNCGSRVDIYIAMANDARPYIIEVKIGDRNHHFGQYEEAYGIGKDRFGYITNYDCTEGKEAGYDVKTWEAFYDYMADSDTESELISAFASYLKNVCGIIKFEKPMNITGLDSIPCFVETVKSIIAKGREWVNTEYYREYAYSLSIHEGFDIRFPGCAESGFAVFGLWYQETPVITIGINARKWLSDRIMEDKKNATVRSRFAKPPYRETFWNKDDVWYELSDEKLQEFMAADSYESQRQILDDFFEEVMMRIQKYFCPDVAI